MNSQNDQTSYTGGPEAAFSFDRRQNGMRFSADLGRIWQEVGEQVRNAVSEIDFESMGDDVRRAMMEVGAEVREAVDNFSREQQWTSSGRVNVDVQYDPAAASAKPAATTQPAPRPDSLTRERTAILMMVAEGKITPQQAEQLLDALGG